MTWKPWHLITVAIAGWMNRQQQEAIEYLRTEHRILREKLGHTRILLNDAQKRCLAEAAAELGRGLLRQFSTLSSPETFLKWRRTLVARKYDGSDRRGKRGSTLAAFVAGIRRECLNKMFLLSERHVRYVIQSFAEHYNRKRQHKALGYCRPVEPDDPPTMEGVVKCHECVGGLLKSYYREAA